MQTAESCVVERRFWAAWRSLLCKSTASKSTRAQAAWLARFLK
jgi:hypothetical protein